MLKIHVVKLRDLNLLLLLRSEGIIRRWISVTIDEFGRLSVATDFYRTVWFSWCYFYDSCGGERFRRRWHEGFIRVEIILFLIQDLSMIVMIR